MVRPHFFNARLLYAVLALCVSLAQTVSVTAADGKPTIPPEAKPIFDKAVAYLNSRTEKLNRGQLSLAALAMVKAGQPKNNGVIVKALEQMEHMFKEGDDGTLTYRPHSNSEGVYEGGVDIMLLLAVNAEKYRPEVAAITDYLISRQLPDGSWTYPEKTVGDTSMSQYALLGFWSAKEAGVEVPLEVWNKAAQWHIRTQLKDGGFAYHPGTNDGPEGGRSTHNLTNAGVGSLFICRMFLYPETEQEKKVVKPKFGVLEEIDPNANKSDAQIEREKAGAIVSRSAIEGAINRGLGWANSHFVLETPNVNKNYYYYTVERVAAFANLKTIGGKDWYSACLGVLKQRQLSDGSWKTFTSPENATSFAILFMVKSTGKLLARPPVGGGLLSGGRGLPDDLGGAKVAGGAVEKKRKPEGDLDKLLTDLAGADLEALEDTQAAIVEKVQIGDRRELLKQMERVRKLAAHPQPSVRMVAIWALGRSRDLRDAGLLIKALQDPDGAVCREANAGLRYMSRKLSGVGVPEDPFEDLPENAPEAQYEAALARWQKAAMAGWSKWYLRVRPYEDRNDAFELTLRNALEKNR